MRPRVAASLLPAPRAAAAAWWTWPARRVYLGGPILTVDAADRVVEALGVEGARIGAVGTRDEVLAWAGAGARIVDLGGHALLPGFVDAHGHFPGTGVTGGYADLWPSPGGDLAGLGILVS